MSELCVVNLKETEMDFGQLNELANKLVNIALEEKIAVLKIISLYRKLFLVLTAMISGFYRCLICSRSY